MSGRAYGEGEGEHMMCEKITEKKKEKRCETDAGLNSMCSLVGVGGECASMDEAAKSRVAESTCV